MILKQKRKNNFLKRKNLFSLFRNGIRNSDSERTNIMKTTIDIGKNGQGARLKDLRKTLGITQREFANEIGVSKSHISQVEQGKNTLSSDLAMMIERKYGKSHEYLLYGTGTSESKVLQIGLSEDSLEMLRIYNDFPVYRDFFNALLKPKSIMLVNCFAFWLSQTKGIFHERIFGRSYLTPISEEVPYQYRQGIMIKSFIGEISSFLVDNKSSSDIEEGVEVLENLWEYTYGKVDKDIGYIVNLVDILLYKKAYFVLTTFIMGLSKGVEESSFSKQDINNIEKNLERRIEEERDKFEEGTREYVLLDNLISEIIGMWRA